MSSEEEGLPRKRRRVCPRIPYVFENKTIVHGCDCCMPLRDTRWFAWMCAGKRLGLPGDVARLIGGLLEKSWAEWKTWIPRNDVKIYVPLDQTRLLSRFCCDRVLSASFRTCYCNPFAYDSLIQGSFDYYFEYGRIAVCISRRFSKICIVNAGLITINK